MFNSKSYAEGILASIEKNPAIVGYLPNSKSDPSSYSHQYKTIRERKILEKFIVSACFQADLDGLKTLSRNIDLVIFERYENYLEPKVENTSVRDVLYKKAIFPDTLRPLAAIGLAFMYGRIQEHQLKDYIDTLCDMGIKKYVVDNRYLAKMTTIMLEHAGSRYDIDKHSVFLSVISSYGFKLKKEDFEQPISGSAIYDQCRLSKSGMSAEETGEVYKKIAIEQKKYGYLRGVIRAKLKGMETGIDNDQIPPLHIAKEWAGFLYGQYQDKTNEVMTQLGVAFDLLDLCKKIDEQLKAVASSKSFFNSRHAKQFTSVSFISTVIKKSTSIGLEERKDLLKSLLAQGFSTYLADECIQLRLIAQLDYIIDSNSLESYKVIKPFLTVDFEKHGFSASDIISIANRHNPYAIEYIRRRIKNDPDYVNRVFRSLSAVEQNSVIKNNLPGFPKSLMKIAKDTEARKKYVAEEMGL